MKFRFFFMQWRCGGVAVFVCNEARVVVVLPLFLPLSLPVHEWRRSHLLGNGCDGAFVASARCRTALPLLRPVMFGNTIIIIIISSSIIIRSAHLLLYVPFSITECMSKRRRSASSCSRYTRHRHRHRLLLLVCPCWVVVDRATIPSRWTTVPSTRSRSRLSCDRYFRMWQRSFRGGVRRLRRFRRWRYVPWWWWW
jgi:hypothetical protein